VAPPSDVERAVSKIRTQKNIKVDHQAIEDADHFYRTPGEKNSDHLPEIEKRVGIYLDKRLSVPPTPHATAKR
jgi:alpha/beta superfamily hydrolase